MTSKIPRCYVPVPDSTFDVSQEVFSSLGELPITLISMEAITQSRRGEEGKETQVTQVTQVTQNEVHKSARETYCPS